MANLLNGTETLLKISIAWVGCTNVKDDRETDTQTDGRTTIYSEREHEFTFANNNNNNNNNTEYKTHAYFFCAAANASAACSLALRCGSIELPSL